MLEICFCFYYDLVLWFWLFCFLLPFGIPHTHIDVARKWLTNNNNNCTIYVFVIEKQHLRITKYLTTRENIVKLKTIKNKAKKITFSKNSLLVVNCVFQFPCRPSDIYSSYMSCRLKRNAQRVKSSMSSSWHKISGEEKKKKNNSSHPNKIPLTNPPQNEALYNPPFIGAERKLK